MKPFFSTARFRHLTTLIATASALLFSSAGWAADTDQASHYSQNRFYVAPLLSYDRAHQDDLGASNHGGLQLSIGKKINSFFAVEGVGFFNADLNLRKTPNSHANMDMKGFGFSTLLWPAGEHLPVFIEASYGAGNINFNHVDNLGHQSTRFYDYGIGYIEPINDFGVSVRAEFRYRHSRVLGGQTHHNFIIRDHIWSLGIQVPLSK